MQVNAAPNVLQTQLQSATAREKSLADFQMTLDAATKSLAQTHTTATNAAPKTQKPVSEMSSAEYLADYLRKGPAQHMREAILKEMGLTEADLAAMPPGQRAAVENAITAKIRELMDEQSAKAREHAVSSK